MMLLSGLPPRLRMTAIVSRQPSPSVVAAIAQPSESRIISFRLSMTSAGSSSNDSLAANSASASVCVVATANVPERLVGIHDELRTLHDRLWSSIERLVKPRYLFARHRIDRHADLRRVGEEYGILHSLHESGAQRARPIGRDSGRSGDGAGDFALAEDDVGGQFLISRFQEVIEIDRIAEIRCILTAKLNQDAHGAVFENLRVARHRRRQEDSAARIHLAALHGEIDAVGALIAFDHLDLGAEHVP